MITGTPHDLSALADVRLAAALAAGAGDVLLALRARIDAGRVPDDADELRRAGDAGAQAWLAAALAEARPDDCVLSEEAADDRRRLSADRVWIIDPLDGTREFAERHRDGTWRDDFAVHVALWARAAGLAAAAVALPARGLVLDTATSSHPADAPVLDVAAGRRPIRLAVSRSHPSALAARLAERGDVELVPMGSSGVKIASVVSGATDAYVHAGGQHEWDTAAPVAVALAAGLVATRLDGSPLAWNQARPWSPDLAVCAPALVPHLRGLLAWAGVAPAGSPRP